MSRPEQHGNIEQRGSTAELRSMLPRHRVWVLNLDSDLELIAPGHFRRTARQANQVAAQAMLLRSSMAPVLGGAPTILEPRLHGASPPVPAGEPGAAWCPTPSALRVLEDAGCPLPQPPPAVSVLRTVNHRAFAAGLAVTDDDPFGHFPAAAFCTGPDDCQALWAGRDDQPFLLKRPLGFSGRQRKVVVPARLDAAARTWIDSSWHGHGAGLMVEPLVERLLDVGLHGLVAADGASLWGEPTVQICDEHGAWRGTRLAAAGELGSAERRALFGAGEACVAALHAAGYHGPLGIDAFRWRDAAGQVRFRALCELNARYTMGWFTGMARQLDTD